MDARQLRASCDLCETLAQGLRSVWQEYTFVVWRKTTHRRQDWDYE